MSKKWKSTQFPVVSGVEEGTGKAPEVVWKEKTFHPAGMQVLILLQDFFFYSNIIWFLTVKVSAFPHTWKADYSFSCSYLLFIPFWYYPRGAEGISQPALEPCGTPVVSPNSWDGSRQLIMILNYIYSNLDSFFLMSWFALELGMGIRNLALKNCNSFLIFLLTSWRLLKKPAPF